MMQKATQALKTLSTNTKIIQSFGGHGAIPDKLKKVQDVAVKFNVKNALGKWEQILAFQGESFLEAIIRSNVYGFNNQQLCNGEDLLYKPHHRPVDPFSQGPSCGRCRIVLKDNWYERVFEQTQGYVVKQKMILISNSDHRQDMRLSCCLPVQQWMQGCTFEIMPETQLSEYTKLY